MPYSKAQRPAQRRQLVPTIVVDRSALFCAGFAHVLANTRFRVIAQAASLAELPPRVLSCGRCVLLLGIDNASDELLSDVMSLRQEHTALRVIVLAESYDERSVAAAIEAGGDCYLLKNELTSEILVKTLEVVLLGAIVVPRGSTLQSLGTERRLRPDEASGPARANVALKSPPAISTAPATAAGHQLVNVLSNREQAILLRLMRGASNKHIARELGIAEATVKIHVKNLLRKIQVRNRTQAAMWGMNHAGVGPHTESTSAPPEEAVSVSVKEATNARWSNASVVTLVQPSGRTLPDPDRF